jgi:hypothetical protein
MSQQKTIEDLRAVLFETIAAVRDGSMSLDKAKTISDLSQVMVNSAKVEVEFVKATSNDGSGFMEKQLDQLQLPAGITGSTVHRMR